MTNLLEALLGASAGSGLRLAVRQSNWLGKYFVHIVSANIGVLELCGAHITGKKYIYCINDYF